MDIPILFGRFLVRKGKISNEALNEAIKVQSEINRREDLEEALKDFRENNTMELI